MPAIPRPCGESKVTLKRTITQSFVYDTTAAPVGALGWDVYTWQSSEGRHLNLVMTIRAPLARSFLHWTMVLGTQGATALAQLQELGRENVVTLLYRAHDRFVWKLPWSTS
jgi:hypothetical protein